MRLRLASFALLLAACDATQPVPDAGMADAHTSNDAYVARIADMAITVTHEVEGTLSREPLVGATVGIAQNGVLVADTVTGADGIAHVDVDWNAGPVDVTAWAPGQRAHTLLALDERAEQTVRLEWLHYDEAGLGHVIGDVSHLARPSMWITASIGPVWSQAYGAAGPFQIDLAQGQPFVLLAFDMNATFESAQPRNTGYDIAHFVALEVPALAGTALTEDVDFDVLPSTPTEVAHARIVLPGEEGDVVYSQSTGSFAVRANLTTAGFLGLFSSCRLTDAEDAFDCTMSYTRIEHATIDPVTRYSLLMNGGVESGVHVRGYPVEGAVIGDLPELPDATVTTAAGLRSVLALSTPTPGFDRIRIFVNDAFTTAWHVDAPAGATTATLPPMPAALAAAAEAWVVGTAYVEACYERDEATDWCGRYASSRDFRIDP